MDIRETFGPCGLTNITIILQKVIFSNECSLIDKLLLGLIEWIRQMKEVHKTQLLLKREQLKNIFSLFLSRTI